MKNTLLSLLLFFLIRTGYCTTWLITSTSSFTFSPSTVTITVGDSVNFQLGAIHNAVEVSLATWNANGISPITGFATPFGGGLVLPAQLTVGTHYYVCQNHGPIGMKGTIIVQSNTGIDENSFLSSISIYPNPSIGKLNLETNGMQSERNCYLEIFNVKGGKIYQTVITSLKSEIDLSNQPKGIYFIEIHNGQSVLTQKIILD